jgi:hypothetical protein
MIVIKLFRFTGTWLEMKKIRRLIKRLKKKMMLMMVKDLERDQGESYTKSSSKARSKSLMRRKDGIVWLGTLAPDMNAIPPECLEGCRPPHVWYTRFETSVI